MPSRRVWEPANVKEVTYYDKLFDVADRDKSGTLDGQEAVKFFSLSGLTAAQLKDVWSLASSHGQTELQRHDFYTAMRAMALAQHGEARLNIKAVRETATNSVPIARLRGAPQPPLKVSRGKKQARSSRKLPRVDAQEKAMSIQTTTATAKTTASAYDVAALKPSGSEGAPGSDHEEGVVMSEKLARAADSDGAAVTSARGTEFDKVGKRVQGGDTVASSPSATCSESGEDSIDNRHWSEQLQSDDSSGTCASDTTSGGDSDHADPGGNHSRVAKEVGIKKDGDVAITSTLSGRRYSARVHNRSSTVDTDSGVRKGVEGGCAKAKRTGGIASESSSDSSSSSVSSSTCTLSKCPDRGEIVHREDTEEGEGADMYAMSENERARYQGIFNKVDAAGVGYVGGRQAVALFAKSGVANADLGTIWRLSDLDQDSKLRAEEFAIAFHLVFCATQRKLDVPDELPESLWPAGYVPPSAITCRKKDAQRERECKHKDRVRHQQDAREPEVENIFSGDQASDRQAGALATGRSKISAKTGAQRGTKPKFDTRGSKGEPSGVDEAAREATRLDRQAAGRANSRQKKEELEKKCAQKRAATKSRIITRDGGKQRIDLQSRTVCLEQEFVASPPSRTSPGVTTLVASDTVGTIGGPTPATSLSVVACNDAPLNVANVGDDRTRIDQSKHAQTRVSARFGQKNKKRTPPSPVTPPTERRSTAAEGADFGRDEAGSDWIKEDTTGVGPLSTADRRARKACARAIRLDKNKVKKEAAQEAERLTALDNQDRLQAFNVQATPSPTRTFPEDKSLHMVSDPGGSGNVRDDGSANGLNGGGGPSFARFTAPLPHLASRPGRATSLETHEFSVSYPSGVRRASSLTSSLDMRLRPAPPMATLPGNADESSNATIRKGVEIDCVGCTECAAVLTSAQMERHIRSTCRLLPCLLCSRLLLPATTELHLTSTCPFRCQSCVRCGGAVPVGTFACHEKGEGGCVRRLISCSACGTFCLADELEEHEAKECSERRVQCVSCGESLTAGQHEAHAASLCRNITWKCGCGHEPLSLVDRKAHLQKCEAFIDAWEASIEKVLAQMPKVQVVRDIGKVMILTRSEEPAVALLALADTKGDASLAARRIADSRAYLDELHLAGDIVNVGVFLRALKKPGSRRKGTLWREQA